MLIPVRVARVLAVAALPLALSACGSSTDHAGDRTTASDAKPKDPNAGIATGAQLKKALAPASYFTGGLAIEPDNARDTGDTYQDPGTKAADKPDCNLLGGTSWIAVTGVDGVSFAQNDYVNKNTSDIVAQEIDAYRGTTASDVLKQAAKIATGCSGYKDSSTHTKVDVAVKPTSGLGDEATTITLTSDGWESGDTLIAARVGTDLVTVLSSEGGKDNGGASARKLAAQIVGSLKKG